MTLLELLRTMRRLDQQHHWLFTRQQLRIMFPGEEEAAQEAALREHIETGELLEVVPGELYANPYPRFSRTSSPLEQIVGYLRPDDLSYVTAESILSERSVISQIMQAWLVAFTTGESGEVEVRWGAHPNARATIELIHTDEAPSELRRQVVYSPTSGIWRAPALKAYKDLVGLDRCLDLVDLDDLDDAVADDIEIDIQAAPEIFQGRQWGLGSD